MYSGGMPDTGSQIEAGLVNVAAFKSDCFVNCRSKYCFGIKRNRSWLYEY